MFGIWPPQTNAVLVGRCVVNADGTLAYSSHYPDGTPVFSSAKTGTGTYQLTPGKPGNVRVPTLNVQVQAGTTARYATTTGALGVDVFTGANASVDGQFAAWLWDEG